MLRIYNIDIDYTSLGPNGETRAFRVNGDIGATFSLEITNEDTPTKWYNFTTKEFTTTQSRLHHQQIPMGGYNGTIDFPSVTDDDHYDIFLWAEEGTEHIDYKEVRFADGTLDINNSTGSNSMLVKKIIYQYTIATLTIDHYSIDGSVLFNGTGYTTDTIEVPRGGTSNGALPFSIMGICNDLTKVFQIIKQPKPRDILGMVSVTLGTPSETLITIGEDIWAGEARSTNNVGGSGGGTGTTFDMAVDIGSPAKWAIGDRVTGNTALNAKTGANAITVTAINVDTGGGADASKITLSESVTIANGTALTFTQAKYHMWAVNNTVGISLGDRLFAPTTYGADSNTTVSNWEYSVTLRQGTPDEQEQRLGFASVIQELKKKTKPTVVNGVVTAQTGNVIFSSALNAASQDSAIKIGANGEQAVYDAHGWRIALSDLEISLVPVSTTTSSSTVGASSTSVVLADRTGIKNSASTLRGVGIDPSTTPTVNSGGGSSSGGTVVLDTAQELETGTTIYVDGTSTRYILSGKIEILEAGNGDETIRFDVNNLVTYS